MPDARHPKKYPAGPKHEALPVTPRWKALVAKRLDENERTGRRPASPSELAAMVGAHKTGLLKMLSSKQRTYKYAQQVNDILKIEAAMVDNPALPEVTDGDLDRAVERLRELPVEKQRQALAILETFIRPLDER